MSDHLESSGKIFEAYHVRGETLSLWIPLSLALIGVINAIFIAQSLQFPEFNKDDLLSTPPKITTQNERQVELPTNGETAGFPVGKTVVAVSTPSAPPHFDDSGAAAVETKISPDVEPGSSLLQKPACPPLFFFTFATASATPDAHRLAPNIERLKIWIEQHPDKKVFIEGHTDAAGPEEYNLLLSYRRMKAAERILLETGISKNQLITRAFGEQEPLQGQSAHSKKNRRATIRVEPLQKCINTLINGDSN